MKAVVMAGGEGTRLRPLTSSRPKPLVPIGNIPVMEYVINLLKKNGITEIVVTLHYLADEIITYFGDGANHKVQITYSIEDEPLGTAGSVKKIEKYLNDTFIVLSADALTDIDLKQVIDFHKEKNCIATIALQRVANPIEYGVVITSDDGKIQKFMEKPGWGEVFSDTVNTGIYILEPVIFDYMAKNQSYDFSRDLFPAILENKKDIYGYITEGYWCDIGNIQQYQQANEDLLKNRFKSDISQKMEKNGIWIDDGAIIHPSANIKSPAIIGKDCRIGADVFIGENTIVGDNCIIEDAVSLDRAILCCNVYVGKSSRLNKCVICKGTTIKSSVTVGEGAVIGDKCFIGQNSTIAPQVKIWPEKHVEAGAYVNMSIVWGAKWSGTLFGTNGVSGMANIEITPDFALKLGAAFGAYLEKGSIIATSRDEHPASRMLNRAIICGLISVGVNVYDLRVMPAPVVRYLIGSNEMKGGMHVKISSEDPQVFIIQFYDETGIVIDRAKERKIENLFFREDFRRTPVDEVGRIDFPARVADQYIQAYIKLLDSKSISDRNFKVVVDYAYGNSSTVLPLILGKLGCETVTLNSYTDIEKARQANIEKDKSLAQLSNIVRTLDADLGIWFNWDAEKMVLVDEEGVIIQNEMLLAFLAKLIIENVNPQLIAVPVTAPSVIETLASSRNCKVIRTKIDDRSLMNVSSVGREKIYFAGNSSGGFIFPRLHPSFDAIFAFAQILELMSKSGQKLSEVRAQIPEFNIVYKNVECAQEFKGKVMRQLIELNRNKDIELLEGIKIFFGGGWINIIPDPIEPYLHLYAEAKTKEEAENVIQEYTDKIHEIKGGEGIVAYRIKERFLSSSELKIPEDMKDKTYAFNLPQEKAFYFWTSKGYLGIKAKNVDEFYNILNYVDIDSIEYHLYKKDFENWLQYELALKNIAAEIEKVRLKNLQGEELREKILDIFSSFKEDIIK